MSLPALLLVLSIGCGRKEKEATRPLPTGPTSLRIENQNWLDVNIYVVHDGQRSRLGSATAAHTTQLEIPPTLLGQLGAIRLIADPVGSPQAITSQAVVVKPGTRLVWTLGTDLNRSSLAVY
ncbi:MAG TPA: hypothetical protein VFR95_03080 [Gemmatimonadaceae bacterium]|nr:hypothetical protein [Gemmatimonadaceae bacterium]